MFEPDSHILFVYGTLLDETKRFEIFGRELALVPDSIEGYGRSQVVGTDGVYPTIVPGGTEVIEGGLLYGLTDAEMRLGDAYETHLYIRQAVQTRNGKHAWTYIGYPESYWW